MSKLDLNKFDIQVTITADDRRGLWASSMFQGGKAIRTGGKLPSEAHAHTLLLVALANTLRSITNTQYKNIRLPHGVTKPRVQVRVVSKAKRQGQVFADALAGLIQRNVSAPRLRAGRNFLATAAQQIARFDLDIIDDSDPRNLVLLTWVQKSLYPESSFEGLAAALVPSVTGQVVNGTL
jgi:hypothetical protein